MSVCGLWKAAFKQCQLGEVAHVEKDEVWGGQFIIMGLLYKPQASLTQHLKAPWRHNACLRAGWRVCGRCG